MEENDQEEQLNSDAPKGSLYIKIIFILFGVASLLGWNALLTELVFFDYFVPSMNPFVSFSFLNYILNIVFLFLMMWKKDLFPLKVQLIGGIIGSIVFLIIIPMFTIMLEKDSFMNRAVTGGLVVLMGFINALCSGGFFNLVSYFPLEMIVSLSAGQGFSGIAMNVLQYVVLASITSDNMDNDDDEKERIYTLRGWVFFGISAFILVICLILLLLNYNSSYFQYYLAKARSSNRDEASTGLIEGEVNPNPEEDGIVEDKTAKKELSFKDLFIRLWDLDLLMMYIYIVTFALFPNASINQNLFGLKDDNEDYNSNTIILIYNVFDTIGRYLVSTVKPNKRLNLIVNLGRTVLLFTLIFNDYCQVKLEWNNNITSPLLILNVGLLALTNGVGTTLSFGLAPNEMEDEYKGQAGTSLSFFLIVGIFLGACIAFGTDAILDSYKKSENN